MNNSKYNYVHMLHNSSHCSYGSNNEEYCAACSSSCSGGHVGVFWKFDLREGSGLKLVSDIQNLDITTLLHA